MILYKTKESKIVRVDGGANGQSLKKYSTTITGDGTKTVFTIEHNLDTEDILFEMSDGTEPALIDYTIVDKNKINTTFAVAPTADEQYNIKIYGTSKPDSNNNIDSDNNGNNSDDNITIDPSKIGTISNDWDYTLDETNNIITLNYYTGSAEDVTVYGNYIVDGVKIYKTNLRSNSGHKTFNYMFAGNRTVKNIVFNDDLDTSSCTDMSHMFYYCKSLTSLDLSNFDTSNVTDMKAMFYGCKSITSLDLSSFDTCNVTNMYCMFYECTTLASILVTNGKWVTSQANTSNIFDLCGVSNVTYI